MTRKFSFVALAATVLLLVAVFFPGLARATFPGGSGSVAYVSGSGAGTQVCVMEIDAPSPTCLTSPWVKEVAVQPISGRWLVFVASWASSSTLYTVDLQANTLSATVVYQVANTTLENPTWIDGSTVAFAESGDIWTAQVQNGQLVGAPVNRTNTAGATESDPTWLPNYRVGYVRDGDLWTMGLQGQSQECVKEAPGSDSCYVTAADESDLNFSLAGVYYAADGNIYRLKLNKYSELTQAPVAVAAARADEGSPTPSPNGKQLVFERAGQLVHVQNATTTMDEKALLAGHMPDWGSVITSLIPEQRPYDVKVEMHGTFAIIDFKTWFPDNDAFAMVRLVDVDTGHEAVEFPDSATKVWSDVVVTTLTPGAKYKLEIHGLGDVYKHPGTFTALTRHVNVTIENVHMIDDADDDFVVDNCGDFTFGFRTFAPGSGQDESWLDVDMCDGENWSSLLFVPLSLQDVPEPGVSIQAFGVDEDCVDLGTGCPFISGGWDNLDAYDSWGPWATKTTSVLVVPDPNAPLDEELTRTFSMTAHGSSGEPDFTVKGSVEVTYS